MEPLNVKNLSGKPFSRGLHIRDKRVEMSGQRSTAIVNCSLNLKIKNLSVNIIFGMYGLVLSTCMRNPPMPVMIAHPIK